VVGHLQTFQAAIRFESDAMRPLNQQRRRETIGRWYWRYLRINRRDERPSHFRLHQHFSVRIPSRSTSPSALRKACQLGISNKVPK
jgi:hypothetical protein